jgi:ubiquinone/menaquinone biosynthesis C-methylase UbiE
MSLQRDPERNESKALRGFLDFRGKRVLEVGCGEGRMTWLYAGDCESVTGIDRDIDALRIARVDKPPALAGKVHFGAADAPYLPFAKEKFDIAILAWSL